MSRTLLHLDSSILGDASASRVLSSHVVDHLRQKVPALRVTYRDLAAEPIPHLSGPYLAATRGDPKAPFDGPMRRDLALGETIMDEFLSADIVVIGVAFYNFSIASQLKAWIDRIAIAGKTFRYTEGRPQGLAGDKRIFLAVARGGFYGEGSPAQAMEHAETYLRSAFSFIGIQQVDVVAAEGLNVSPAQRQAAMAQAQERITQAVATLQS
ncbi:NAD(P)H-dependent oxidoreductase [Lysobacter sp. KIS68-7]|uniref:FMN-dependent NADH-azoreductase n=1 Tax=Lysobacter sp. KIS68-7 TaxID=2904252 RepID=UPI001E4FFFAD|nr:NAD(P)H-dependent oxidoreductase [Lysobacter sp. KIS68-7]UHQ19385.1 NAD(P)H-dependent oxidoreductase [Lysobacter sp. KIS68-7]